MPIEYKRLGIIFISPVLLKICPLSISFPKTVNISFCLLTVSNYRNLLSNRSADTKNSAIFLNLIVILRNIS